MKRLLGDPNDREGRPRLRPRWAAWAMVVLAPAAAGVLAGCSMFPMGPFPAGSRDGGFLGWQVSAPFDTSEVKTVYVYFKSQRFRRDLQIMLEESVTKEINMRTPYRTVGRLDQADATLDGIITVDDKNLIVEAPTNLPRQLNATMTVWITFKHNPPKESEKDMPPTIITETLQFVPEIGQTTMTSFQQVTENIAKQIVDMMEQPWFNASDLE